MSKKIETATLTEGNHDSASRRLTDDDLSLVAGGRCLLGINPFVRQVLETAGISTSDCLEIGPVSFLA